MWDSSSTEAERPLRSTLLRWLPAILIVMLGLGLVSCFFWHPELTATGLAIVPHQTATSVPAAEAAGVQAAAPVTAASEAPAGNQGTESGASTALPAITTARSPVAPAGQMAAAPAAANEQLDLLIGQLQTMQGSLEIMTQELDRRYPTASAPMAPAAMDLATVLAEMERLNQVMQPLMAQIETARQSGRSPAEVAAMQAQMSEIHHRLVELMAAVETARTSNNSGQ